MSSNPKIQSITYSICKSPYNLLDAVDMVSFNNVSWAPVHYILTCHSSCTTSVNNTEIYDCFLSLSEGHIPVMSGRGEGMRNRQLKMNKLCDTMEMTNALKLWHSLSGIQISHK